MSAGGSNLQRVLSNTGWLVGDKILRMGIGLLVSVWLARYLGPTEFGLFNYVQAFVALFSVLATLGLDSIVVRDLVRAPQSSSSLLASAFLLRLSGALVAVLLASISILWVRPGDPVVWLLVTILALALLPQSSDVMDLRYQADTNVRPVVLLRNLVFIVFAMVKIGFLLLHSPLIYFAWVMLLECISASLLVFLHAKRDAVLFHLADGSWSECWRLLRTGWPLIGYSMSAVLYIRIDQFMLGQMSGDAAVGIFSAATRFSEAWGFLPMVVVASLAPTLTDIHIRQSGRYHAELLRLMRFLVALAIIFSFGVAIFSKSLILHIFGDDYVLSANVLSIHVWASVFVCFSVVSGHWYINNDENIIGMMHRALCGLVVNICFNLLLIPKYGVAGAAISSVAGQFFAAFLFDIFSAKTRVLFWLKVRVFCVGWKRCSGV